MFSYFDSDQPQAYSSELLAQAKVPPGVLKQLEKAVQTHQEKPSTKNTTFTQQTASDAGITTTQAPELSAEQHAVVESAAVAPAEEIVTDKEVFSIGSGHIQYHQYGQQYLLTIQPTGLAVAMASGLLLLLILIYSVVSKVKIARPDTHSQVKRIEL